MSPLEYMKKELEIMAGTYEQHIVDCALDIATEYDNEGHSGHSIGWFSNRFKQICQSVFVNHPEPLTRTWVEIISEMDIKLGAGELEQIARDGFDTRIDVLDKHHIVTKAELNQVLEAVTLYTKMRPIRKIDLKDESKYKDKHNWGIHYHEDDIRFYRGADLQLMVSDLCCMSDNGGDAWFTNRHCNGKIDTDFDPLFRRYYILVDEERNVQKPIRVTKPGSIVRNMFGDKFAIEGITPHPDTTQPYFKLHPIINGALDLANPILVSSSALISDTVEIKELGYTVPLYQHYPTDPENYNVH